MPTTDDNQGRQPAGGDWYTCFRQTKPSAFFGRPVPASYFAFYFDHGNATGQSGFQTRKEAEAYVASRLR
jgi:hypothetical protein